MVATYDGGDPMTSAPIFSGLEISSTHRRGFEALGGAVKAQKQRHGPKLVVESKPAPRDCMPHLDNLMYLIY